MKVDYKREVGEWSEATARELGEIWRGIIVGERPHWTPGPAPKRHPKADDHIVWVMAADEATLLLQMLRRACAE
ncbi:hypothetical protein AB0I81_50390 [Nonomuraea sp. NPDC050404]|uniref:hypothetical protein n=1 Tax=Nonomuraea sp. NPDC050404 TaxID=3155783 RepID=UPI0033DD5A37